MVEPNSIFWDVQDMWNEIETETDLVYDIFEKWKALYGEPSPQEWADAAERAQRSKPVYDEHGRPHDQPPWPSPLSSSSSAGAASTASAGAAADARAGAGAASKRSKVLASVDVIVVSGSDLEMHSADLKIAPYVSVLHGRTGKFTTSRKDSVDPTWKETCSFDITDWSKEATLLFEVYDHEQEKSQGLLGHVKPTAIMRPIITKDVFIGKAAVDLRTLTCTTPEVARIHELTLRLDKVSTGHINVKVCVTLSEGCVAPIVAPVSSSSQHAEAAPAEAEAAPVSASPQLSSTAPLLASSSAPVASLVDTLKDAALPPTSAAEAPSSNTTADVGAHALAPAATSLPSADRARAAIANGGAATDAPVPSSPSTSSTTAGATPSRPAQAATSFINADQPSSSSSPLPASVVMPARANQSALASTSSLDDSSAHVISGFVFKRFHKTGGFKNWKRRYASIASSPNDAGVLCLKYYKRKPTSERDEREPKGTMMMRSGEAKVSIVTLRELEDRTGIKPPPNTGGRVCENILTISKTETWWHAGQTSTVRSASASRDLNIRRDTLSAGEAALLLCFDTQQALEKWTNAIESMLASNSSSSIGGRRLRSDAHSVDRPPSSIEEIWDVPDAPNGDADDDNNSRTRSSADARPASLSSASSSPSPSPSSPRSPSRWSMSLPTETRGASPSVMERVRALNRRTAD